MSQKNSQKEIEEAHKKVRGEEKKLEEKKSEQKDSLGRNDEKVSEKKEVEEILKEDETKSLEGKDKEASRQKQDRKNDLEDIARKGAAAPAETHDSPYVEQLSHRPMGDLYKEVKQLYQIAEDKGYLSPTEQKQVEYLSSAVQRKFEDEEQGTYSFSEQAARAASVTQQLSSTLMGSYKGKKNEMYRS